MHPFRLFNQLSFSVLGKAAYLFKHIMKVDRRNFRLKRQQKVGGGGGWVCVELLMEKITPGCYSKKHSHLFSIWISSLPWKIEMVLVFFEGNNVIRMNGKGDSSLQRISGV